MSRRNPVFPHGTPQGYRRHQREGTLEDIDRLGCGCRAAYNLNRQAYMRRLGVQPHPPVKCGTRSGYETALRRRRKGQPNCGPCAGCTRANADYQLAYYHSKASR